MKQAKFQEALSVMLTMTFLFGEHALLRICRPPNQDRLLQPVLFRQWQRHPHWWKIEGFSCISVLYASAPSPKSTLWPPVQGGRMKKNSPAMHIFFTGLNIKLCFCVTSIFHSHARHKYWQKARGKKTKEGGKKTRHHYGKCENKNIHKSLNEAYRPLP